MGLFSDITNVARLVPGVAFAERQVLAVERLVLREFQHRVDRAVAELEPPSPGTHRTDAGADGTGTEPTPAQTLERLLRRSMDQTPAQSKRTLIDHVLHELVPDEARILAALSDGSTYPVIHVAAHGSAHRHVENASSVGRAAGVAVPGMVPTYVTHLLRIGLAELSDEDPTMREEYEILLTDQTVQGPYQAAIADSGRRSPRLTRKTLRISAFGQELWEYCRAEDTAQAR